MNEKNSQDSKEKKTRLNLGDRQLSSPGSPRKKTFGRGKFNVGSVVVVKKKRRSNSSASVSSFGEKKKSLQKTSSKLETRIKPQDISSELRPRTSPKGKVILKTLTAEEKKARAKAPESAKKADQIARDKAEKKAEKYRVGREKIQKEKLESKKRQDEENARKEAASKSVKQAEEKAQTVLEEEYGKKERKKLPQQKVSNVYESRRQKGKLTLARVMDEDNVRQRSLASVKRFREKERKANRSLSLDPESQKVLREVTVPEMITVGELANRMAEKTNDIIKSLMKMGVVATINHALDQDTAELIIAEFGHKVKRVAESDVEDAIKDIKKDTEKDMKSRPPVVTIMGHVDHGKTSLLDTIRQSRVAEKESGGITQHIGAYQVNEIKTKKIITFIDTPGHEAFSEMRARGAKFTDIVVLVIAADDGVKPQTVESIQHCKNAQVPIIIAFNKCDKDSKNINKISQELLENEIILESMGGEILSVEVSATKKINIDKLIESIILQSDLMELKANPNRAASGLIVEAKLDKGKGPLATILVQKGTLNKRDIFVAGSVWGRVRSMVDDKGNDITNASPSQPVQILGLNALPNAGDAFSVVDSEEQAREISNYRERKIRESKNLRLATASNVDQIFTEIKNKPLDSLSLVIKSDVKGSSEAIRSSLEKLKNEKIETKIILSGVGEITESDISLAMVSNALVVGFNVDANKEAKDLAKSKGIPVVYFDIIYKLIEEVKNRLTGKLSPIIKENLVGSAQVLQIFKMSKYGVIGGCKIDNGLIKQSCKIKLMRDKKVIYEGKIKTLMRDKNEVKEVNEGLECGIRLVDHQDIMQGDIIEAYDVQEMKQVFEPLQ